METWHCDCQAKRRQSRCKSHARAARESKTQSQLDRQRATAPMSSAKERDSLKILKKESSPPDAVKIAWNYIGILIRENDNHIKSRERRFIIYSDTRKIDTPGFCVLGGRNICKNILT